MSWRLVQGVPCLRLETASIGFSNKLYDPLTKGIKKLHTSDYEPIELVDCCLNQVAGVKIAES